MKSLIHFSLLIMFMTSTVAGVILNSGCGKNGPTHLSEYQLWIDQNVAIRDMINVYCEAFYRQYGRMPASLDELKTSQWYLLDPVAPEFAENFDIVSEALGEYETDKDKICLSFTETGFEYSHYLRASEETGAPHITKLNKDDTVTAFKNLIQQDIATGEFDVTNPGYIRQNFVFAISRLLARRYYEIYHTMPDNPVDLYKGWWEVNGSCAGSLPAIPEGRPNYVYIGFAMDGDVGVLYVELTKLNGTPFIDRRAYSSVTQGNIVTVKESKMEDPSTTTEEETENSSATAEESTDESGKVEEDKEEVKLIEKKDTVPFIDSSLPNWGL